MNPPMHTRVMNYFTDAGLTDGYTAQLLFWDESDDKTESFMVFRPRGGSAIQQDLAAQHFIGVDVIGARGNVEQLDNRVNEIIDYVQNNPLSDFCVGYIQNMGGIPAPVLTSEGRAVFRLQFACTFGD